MNDNIDTNKLKDVKFGASAFEGSKNELPSVFPREMGPNALRYLENVVVSGLASDMIGRFEKTFAKYHNRKYCIATPGCTPALFALFLGFDFEPGSEIIVSSIADYGDVCGLLFENYIPVFCDVDEKTGLITADKIKPLITERTRAILAVNFFGLTCDFDPIIKLAKQHDIIVIEDACQSILARYKGRLSGTLTDVAVFSFDSEKTLGGDMGGAILLDDDELYGRIVNRAMSRGAKSFPDFGRKHIYRGMALRMPQCTAATCLANFEIIERQVENRTAMGNKLTDLLSDIPGVRVYEVSQDQTHSYWMYGFSIDPMHFVCTASKLAALLKEEGIADCGLGRYYVLPASVTFLAENALKKQYPYNLVDKEYDYDPVRTCPNAVTFMESFIRWFWTEKYNEEHINIIAEIIRKVVVKTHI